jgi:hypothetical protein
LFLLKSRIVRQGPEGPTFEEEEWTPSWRTLKIFLTWRFWQCWYTQYVHFIFYEPDILNEPFMI